MKSDKLENSFYKDIENKQFKIAILPWGATEAHNYHLPYGTDTFLAEELSKRAVEIANKKGAKSILLPSIAYGVNSGHLDIPLCMNITPSTQLSILRDIIFVLEYQNIDKLIIVNGHGGNSFKPLIKELNIEYPDTLIVTIDWWKICEGSEFFDNPGDHAGELETSSMSYLFPDKVQALDLAGEGKIHKFRIDALNSGWAYIPRKWPLTTDDTGVGDPSKSTPIKGEAFVKCCVDKLAKFVIDFSKIKCEEDLYE